MMDARQQCSIPKRLFSVVRKMRQTNYYQSKFGLRFTIVHIIQNKNIYYGTFMHSAASVMYIRCTEMHWIQFGGE